MTANFPAPAMRPAPPLNEAEGRDTRNGRFSRPYSPQARARGEAAIMRLTLFVEIQVGAPLKLLLDAMKRSEGYILLNSNGEKWTSDDFRSSWANLMSEWVGGRGLSPKLPRLLVIRQMRRQIVVWRTMRSRNWSRFGRSWPRSLLLARKWRVDDLRVWHG